MAPALVSIVTPCLNPGRARLERCLDSVAAQTYSPIEHIVMDGGSTDGTVELLRERGTRFVSEPDTGQSNALNKGFALAHGEWLTWLNADDTLVPDAIEHAVTAADGRPDVGLVYGDVELVREDHRYVLPRPPERLELADLDNGAIFSQPGTLFARWALDLVGPLDESLELTMDFDLWLRLVLAGVGSVYAPHVLATYEVHRDSKTGSLHWSAFEAEFGKTLLAHGRRDAASAILGRAAASAARGASDLTDRAQLEREIQRMTAFAGARANEVNQLLLRAEAYAEAAERELRFAHNFRYLLRPEPWLARSTRSRLGRALADGLKRVLRRN